jgi:FkbM family methyltransferase
MFQGLSRIQNLIRRRRSAKRLGFTFQRAANFTTPAALLNDETGRYMPLHLPKDAGTRAAFIDVFLDDAYGLLELPDSVSTIVDIGCHAGLFAAFARLRWPHASIHGYEPNPQMTPFWEQQSTEFQFIVHPQAVGLSPGFISMQSAADSVHARTQSILGGAIPQCAFADTLSRHGDCVDLVKLDCEGAEWDILKDIPSWRRVRHLTMEFHLWAGYSLEDLRAHLRRMNWQVNHCTFQGEDFGLLRAINLAPPETARS